MKIIIDRGMKVALLQALRDGCLDTDKIPGLKGSLIEGDPFGIMRVLNRIDEL